MQCGILYCNVPSTKFSRKKTQAKQVAIIAVRQGPRIFFSVCAVCQLLALCWPHVAPRNKQQIGKLNWADERHNSITQLLDIGIHRFLLSQTTIRLWETPKISTTWGSFNVHRHVHVPPPRNPQSGIDPATLGSAAECHSHQTHHGSGYATPATG